MSHCCIVGHHSHPKVNSPLNWKPMKLVKWRGNCSWNLENSACGTVLNTFQSLHKMSRDSHKKRITIVYPGSRAETGGIFGNRISDMQDPNRTRLPACLRRNMCWPTSTCIPAKLNLKSCVSHIDKSPKVKQLISSLLIAIGRCQ